MHLFYNFLTPLPLLPSLLQKSLNCLYLGSDAAKCDVMDLMGAANGVALLDSRNAAFAFNVMNNFVIFGIRYYC